MLRTAQTPPRLSSESSVDRADVRQLQVEDASGVQRVADPQEHRSRVVEVLQNVVGANRIVPAARDLEVVEPDDMKVEAMAIARRSNG